MARFRLFDLNDAQQRAVKCTEGPLLILAGAGTGKTRVITARVACLVMQGTDPAHILAVTFTNKAATEMRERLERILEAEAAAKVTMSTFHALCLRILRANIDRLGYKNNFSIYDEGDQLGLIRKIITRTAAREEKLDPTLAKNAISKAKNNSWKPPDGDETLLGAVFARYQAELKTLNAVDFDDLLLLAVRLLSEHADVRERWRARFRYLMVDEFQDTNKLQLELVTLLADERRNVAVVGDDDQSIYGWRGAEVSNILEFEHHFPNPTISLLMEPWDPDARDATYCTPYLNRQVLIDGPPGKLVVSSVFKNGFGMTDAAATSAMSRCGIPSRTHSHAVSRDPCMTGRVSSTQSSATLPCAWAERTMPSAVP